MGNFEKQRKRDGQKGKEIKKVWFISCDFSELNKFIHCTCCYGGMCVFCNFSVHWVEWNVITLRWRKQLKTIAPTHKANHWIVILNLSSYFKLREIPASAPEPENKVQRRCEYVAKYTNQFDSQLKTMTTKMEHFNYERGLQCMYAHYVHKYTMSYERGDGGLGIRKTQS